MELTQKEQAAAQAAIAKVRQAEIKKGNNKLKNKIKRKHKAADRKIGYQLADDKLKGLTAWAKFLQSENGYSFVHYMGLNIDFEVRRLEILRAWEQLDEAKIKDSPLNRAQLANRGKLILINKDGTRCRNFTTAQVVRGLRYIAKVGSREKLLSKAA